METELYFNINIVSLPYCENTFLNICTYVYFEHIIFCTHIHIHLL